MQSACYKALIIRAVRGSNTNYPSSERAELRFKQKVSRNSLQASLVQAPMHKVSSPRRTTAHVPYTAKVICTFLLHAKNKLTTRPYVTRAL